MAGNRPDLSPNEKLRGEWGEVANLGNNECPSILVASRNKPASGMGGELYFRSPSRFFFRDISRNYKRIIAKFSVPSYPSIWHIMTKGKPASFNTWTYVALIRGKPFGHTAMQKNCAFFIFKCAHN